MGIVRPVMAVHPFAWAFFVPFILIVSFAVLNLFIAVVVDSMQQVHKEEADELMRDAEEIAQREADALQEQLRGLKEDIALLRSELKARDKS